MPWLREIRPDPIVEIHPDTAQQHGIEEGDWVYITSPRGRVKERAKLNAGIDPRVIVAEHGWWYPEIMDPGAWLGYIQYQYADGQCPRNHGSGDRRNQPESMFV